MSDLTKNKAANALVWAAFFAFWLHSLHCCQTHTANERCVFELTRRRPNNGSPNQNCVAFHCSEHFSGSTARLPLRFTPRFERTVESKTPSLAPNRRSETPACANVCPPPQIVSKEKNFGDLDLFATRTLGDVSASDVRLVPASTFLTRFAATFSTPLYLLLRKLLN